MGAPAAGGVVAAGGGLVGLGVGLARAELAGLVVAGGLVLVVEVIAMAHVWRAVGLAVAGGLLCWWLFRVQWWWGRLDGVIAGGMHAGGGHQGNSQ